MIYLLMPTLTPRPRSAAAWMRAVTVVIGTVARLRCCQLFASKGVGTGPIRLASAWSSGLSGRCCRVFNQTTILRKPGRKGGRPGLYEAFGRVLLCERGTPTLAWDSRSAKARRRLRAGSPGRDAVGRCVLIHLVRSTLWCQRPSESFGGRALKKDMPVLPAEGYRKPLSSRSNQRQACEPQLTPENIHRCSELPRNNLAPCHL
jgi:hypothetical protein